MITKSCLKGERGWTDKLIKTFLPEPDLVLPNPRFRSGADMQLFKVSRIELIEKSEEFKAQEQGTAKRKASAKKAVETKLERLQEYLANVKIEVPVLSKDELIKRACQHYNSIQSWRENEGRKTCGMTADKYSATDFLERICVNYLRHALTKYEQHLDEISGKVGVYDGYLEIRHKIFEKISGVYPWLKVECLRQEEYKKNEQE